MPQPNLEAVAKLCPEDLGPVIEIRGRKLAIPDPARPESVGSFNPDCLHLDTEDGHRDSLKREGA